MRETDFTLFNNLFLFSKSETGSFLILFMTLILERLSTKVLL